MLTPRQHARRRLALAGAVLGLVLATAVVLVLALGSPGEMPPATGAATIVPADALAYVHLSTDPSRPAVARARSIAGRFPDWPLLQTAALNRLRAIVGGSNSADFATGIRPWLGKEAGLALIAGPGGSAQSLVVLDVPRRPQAQAFLTRAGC